MILGTIAFLQFTVAKAQNPPLDNWQYRGTLAGLADEIPDVQIYAISKMNELDMLRYIPEEYIPRLIALLEYENLDSTLYPFQTSYYYPSYWEAPNTVAKALGILGDSVKPYVPDIIKLLSSEKSQTRFAAIQTLAEFDNAVIQDYVPDIISLLMHSNADVRSFAARSLGVFSDISNEDILSIIALLDHEEITVRISALEALEVLGEDAKEYCPAISELLSDDAEDWEVRSTAARVLAILNTPPKNKITQIITPLATITQGQTNPYPYIDALSKMGEENPETIPQIIGLLRSNMWSFVAARTLINLKKDVLPFLPQILPILDHRDSSVKANVINLLGELGTEAKDTIPEIAAFLDRSDWTLRSSALRALGNFGSDAQQYIPKMISFIGKTYSSPQGYDDVVASALGNMGESVDFIPYIPQIVVLLDSNDAQTKISAMLALGGLHQYSKEYLPQIASFLNDKDEKFRIAAISSIGKFEGEAREYIPQIIELLNDRNEGVRTAAAGALEYLGQVDVKQIPTILNSIYNNTFQSAKFRFLIHFVGAGKEDVEILLRWLGEPENNYPTILTYDQAKETLQLFDLIWDKSLSFPKVYSDLSKQIAVVTGQNRINWRREDLSFLQAFWEQLQTINSTHADSIKSVILRIKSRSWIFRIAKAWLIHATFWILILLLYPYSS